MIEKSDSGRIKLFERSEEYKPYFFQLLTETDKEFSGLVGACVCVCMHTWGGATNYTENSKG